MKTGAKLSGDRKYRYALWRIWDDEKAKAMFIGLNPSTADEAKDDPTVKRCMWFARSWGYGGLIITNLFAFRATTPEDMMNVSDPIGPENDKWIRIFSHKAKLVVAIWGNRGMFKGRGQEVMSQFHNLYAIKLNKSGQPAHPLYLKSILKPKLI